MMQHKHVEVAAHHALTILRWTVSSAPLSSLELHEAFDVIYQDSDAGRQLSTANGSYGTWKRITFDGVALAYHHFFGKQPDIWAIRKFLDKAGNNADWGRLMESA